MGNRNDGVGIANDKELKKLVTDSGIHNDPVLHTIKPGNEQLVADDKRDYVENPVKPLWAFNTGHTFTPNYEPGKRDAAFDIHFSTVPILSTDDGFALTGGADIYTVSRNITTYGPKIGVSKTFDFNNLEEEHRLLIGTSFSRNWDNYDPSSFEAEANRSGIVGYNSIDGELKYKNNRFLVQADYKFPLKDAAEYHDEHNSMVKNNIGELVSHHVESSAKINITPLASLSVGYIVAETEIAKTKMDISIHAAVQSYLNNHNLFVEENNLDTSNNSTSTIKYSSVDPKKVGVNVGLTINF